MSEIDKKIFKLNYHPFKVIKISNGKFLVNLGKVYGSSIIPSGITPKIGYNEITDLQLNPNAPVLIGGTIGFVILTIKLKIIEEEPISLSFESAKIIFRASMPTKPRSAREKLTTRNYIIARVSDNKVHQIIHSDIPIMSNVIGIMRGTAEKQDTLYDILAHTVSGTKRVVQNVSASLSGREITRYDKSKAIIRTLILTVTTGIFKFSSSGRTFFFLGPQEQQKKASFLLDNAHKITYTGSITE